MTDRRTLLLLLAAVLLIAVVLVNLDLCGQQIVEEPGVTRVVVALENMEPYSIISPGQVQLGSEEISEAEARKYYQKPENLLGKMTTRFIKAGAKITLADADLIENVRYVEDMDLEIVSFPAVFNEMVAGQVRPGHKVNIYGYQRRTGEDRLGDLVLVASRVWVVDVRTAGGDPVSQEEEAPQQQAGGFLSVPSAGTGAQPASVLTVAAAPEVVQDIIRAFGAAGYSAWVSLAPSSENVWTPTATPTAQPPATPVAVPPTPAVVQTPSAIEATIYMSHDKEGQRRDTFLNGVVTVWVIADLRYSPPDPLPIRIDIRDQNRVLVFEGNYTHSRPGREAYMINRPGGFAGDTRYTTTLYAGNQAFSVEWRTAADAPPLPNTGGETPVLGDD